MDSGVGGSFRVHLQSLDDFARRLEEQLEVVRRSTRSAAIVNRAPDLPLGAFAEAYALSDDHSDAVARSTALLENVVRSIDFARGVTELVARRYSALDTGGAQDIAVPGGASPSSPSVVTPTMSAFPAPAMPAVVPLPVTATAAPPSGSLAPPEAPARLVSPPAGGTVYYSTGTVQPKDA
jgi:hypothetical protein